MGDWLWEQKAQVVELTVNLFFEDGRRVCPAHEMLTKEAITYTLRQQIRR